MNRLIQLALLFFLPAALYAQSALISKTLLAKKASQKINSHFLEPVLRPSGARLGQKNALPGHVGTALDGNVADALEKAVKVSLESYDPELASILHEENEQILADLAPGVFPNGDLVETFVHQRQRAEYVKLFIRRYQDVMQFRELLRSPAFTKFPHVLSAESIDYTEFIPAEYNYIYLGESHNNPAIQREIKTLLTQYRQAYPERTIYLCAEFIFEMAPFMAGKENFADMRPYALFSPEDEKLFRYFVEELDVKLIGLAPEFLYKEKLAAGRDRQIHQMVNAANVTLHRVRERNKNWVKQLRRVEEADPNGVKFIYGGAGHLLYNQLDNVPSMIKRPDQMAVYFTTPLTLASNQKSYFWRKLAYRSIQKNLPYTIGLFNTPQETRLFGADLIVTINN